VTAPLRLDPPSAGPAAKPEPACRGRTGLFFAPHAESAKQRERRESQARALCLVCPWLEPCRTWARSNREYGFWGGESEEERAAAGYPVPIPLGRASRLIRSWRANGSSPSSPASGRPPEEDAASGRSDPREELRRLLISRALREGPPAATAETRPQA
jgi:WhiB family transcriptional regulator, redox-sensing transcriptional regulator